MPHFELAALDVRIVALSNVGILLHICGSQHRFNTCEFLLSFQSSDKLGLSLELGSFVAGIMISTTDFAQHTLDQVLFCVLLVTWNEFFIDPFWRKKERKRKQIGNQLVVEYDAFLHYRWSRFVTYLQLSSFQALECSYMYTSCGATWTFF